jgi:crotonobetainyl-CoA:carnitine CoA-transferase CaiB-like acyl-CoA transferase
MNREGLLDDIFILDLTDEEAGFCAKLLADLGATVIKIESPKGDPSRTGLSFTYCNTNKLGIVLDLETPEGIRSFRNLIHRSDILIENWDPGRQKPLHLNYQKLRRMNPGLIHISITGFGRSGPKQAYSSHDVVAAAFGGQMFITGTPSGPPVNLDGRQTGYVASLFGANAALLALRKRKLTGKGCSVDISIQEAVASTLDPVMIDYFDNGRIVGRHGHRDRNDSFTVFPCKDGYILATIHRNWEPLLELMAAEGKAKDLMKAKWQQASYREKHHDRIVKAIGEWTQSHSKWDLFELGQALQFPWAPIASPMEVLKSPQLHARRFFTYPAMPETNPRIPIPGLPYKFSGFAPSPPKPAPLQGEHTQKVLKSLSDGDSQSRTTQEIRPRASIKAGNILKGIRILDLTRMLSGPYATRILGDFGAEIIKVQSRLTAHGAERNGTPYFRAWNRNKRSLSLNLSRPEARDLFLELTSISDVVVENFSPRVLENWGLTYECLKKTKPNLIMASISAMGQTGTWRNFVGYAPTFHALSGLLSVGSRSANAPIHIGHAYGDVIAGLYAALAILASIEHRDATGEGQYIDLSAYEALCTLLGPTLMEAASARTRRSRNCSCDDLSKTLTGCYPCKGADRWCVLSIADEKKWRAFCRISGIPELRLLRFSSFASRKTHRTQLDALISQCTSRYKAETIVRCLQEAGVPAGVVQNARDLAKDNHLAARNFFVSFNSPEFGTRISDRSALWPCREKHSGWKPAPQLGADNRYVLSHLLGYSEAQLQSFVKSGILT